MNGDEDLGEDIIMKGEPYHYNQKQMARPSSLLQIDTKERWVELPDCPVNLTSTDIALDPDLDNAIIATCKGHGTTYAYPDIRN